MAASSVQSTRSHPSFLGSNGKFQDFPGTKATRDGTLLNSPVVYLKQLPLFSIDNTCYILYVDNTFSANTLIIKYFNGVTVMNTLTKLAINKKISAIFADGTSKMTSAGTVHSPLVLGGAA